MLKERGFKSLINEDMPTPSPPIPKMNPNYDSSEPLYEARKYLKEVIVTFKGLKREKLWAWIEEINSKLTHIYISIS